MILIAFVQAPYRVKNYVQHTHIVCSDWPNDLQYQEVNLDVHFSQSAAFVVSLIPFLRSVEGSYRLPPPEDLLC